MFRIFIILFLNLSFLFVRGNDDKTLDSLFHSLNRAKHDTVVGITNYRIGYHFMESGLGDSSYKYFKIALDIAVKENLPNLLYNCYKEIGYYHYTIGEYDSSVVYNNRALSLIKNNDARYREIYSILGSTYFFKGDFIKAYEYYLKNLHYCEIKSSPKQLSRAYSTVGVALKEQKKLDEALTFFIKALDIAKKNNIKSETYVNQTNIGNIYVDRYYKNRSSYNINTALNYYLEAKEIVKDLLEQDIAKSNATILYGNIGNIYADLKQYDKALAEYKEALVLIESMEFFSSKSMIYNNLASIYIDMKKAMEGAKYLSLARRAAEESRSPNDIMENYKIYSRLYELNNDYKKAYLYQLRFKSLSDSLFSTENAEKRKEIELNLEFEKKEATARIELEKKAVIDKEEKRRQQIFRNALIVGFVLMLLVAFLIFRSYRIKKKSNEIITQQKLEVEKQKEIIEEKQKEIIDSIKYAKRIQQSLMPTEKYIEKTLKRLHD